MAKRLLNDSYPLILSSIAVALFMRIDQIMLGEMGGDKAVGIYSAATRISEIWYFIPLIIASSLFPSLLRIKNENTDLFYRKFSDLFRLLTVISLCVAIPIVFLSDFVIRLLYGVQYAESASILTLHIWGGIFASLGIAQGKYWISNNLQKLQLLITVLSAIINIVLNYVFIPLFGAKGAAISTIITLSVGTILTPFIFKDARKIATITFLSLFLIPWKTKR